MQPGLSAGAIAWAAGPQALEIHADAYLDCRAYRQQGRVILHMVNLTGTGEWPAYMEHALPTGPVTVELAGDLPLHRAKLTVADREVVPESRNGLLRVEIDNIRGHEMLVLE